MRLPALSKIVVGSHPNTNADALPEGFLEELRNNPNNEFNTWQVSITFGIKYLIVPVKSNLFKQGIVHSVKHDNLVKNLQKWSAFKADGGFFLMAFRMTDYDEKRQANVAFLKLLIDISSIESTYTSNHTLAECEFRRYDDDSPYNEIEALVIIACRENRNAPHIIGREKVIRYQLSSQKRKKLCELQGANYYSDSIIFADIEPLLLPRILALIGSRHGQSEFYTALIPMAPDLLSYIDREALIDNEIATNTLQGLVIAAQITALTQHLYILSAKNDQLSRRRAMFGQGATQAGTAAAQTGVNVPPASSSSSTQAAQPIAPVLPAVTYNITNNITIQAAPQGVQSLMSQAPPQVYQNTQAVRVGDKKRKVKH